MQLVATCERCGKTKIFLGKDILGLGEAFDRAGWRDYSVDLNREMEFLCPLCDQEGFDPRPGPDRMTTSAQDGRSHDG